MRRLGLVLLTALVGCGSPDDRGGANVMGDAGSQPTPHDATGSGDATIAPPPGSSDIERTPFTTTGTTPAGSLDDVQFVSIDYIGGYCPASYYVSLYRTDTPQDPAVAWFDLTVPWNATRPVTGTLMASAHAGTATTDDVSFEIVQLDAPHPDDVTQPVMVRIAGRFTINVTGWDVDFNVDATLPRKDCLIL